MTAIQNRPTVIFLDYFEDLAKAIPPIKRICAKLKHKPVVVASNFDVNPLNKSLDLKILCFDEFLSTQDYEFMDRYVFNLTQTWYSRLKPIEGITEYRGIQFGAMVEERAQRVFSSTVKNLEIILKTIDRFYPQRIILIGKRDIFQNLSVFIEEKLNTPSLFVEAREKNSSVSEIVRKFRHCAIEKITNICDIPMRIIAIREKRKNAIFIDARLYFQLKDLSKEYFPYLYLIEKGLRLRLKLIQDKSLIFAPLLVEDFFKIVNIFNPFYRYWKSIIADMEFQDKFEYKNLPIWGILEKFIKELIIYDFSQTKKNITFLQRLYKALQPKLVVLREAVRMPERTILFTAKQANIPTLVIQHGILARRNVHTRLDSDKIALWGKAGIDWYRAYGRDVTKCVITGKLQHDILNFQKDNYEREGRNILLRSGLDTEKQTILYLPAHLKTGRRAYDVYFSPEMELISLNSIINLARSFPDKQLIIKIHPFDLLNVETLYNNPEIKKHPNIFVIKNVNTIPLVKVSSLVITSLFSSSAIDAVIFNKPVVTLNFYKREDLVPFAQRGVALGVTKPEQLPQAVRQIFEGQELKDRLASNRESFIYDYAYKIDGKSKQRVLSLIKKLAANEYITSQSPL